MSSGNYKDYEKYLNFAQSCSSKEIKNVWLELSFFQPLDAGNEKLDNADDCINAAGRLDSKFTNIFSHDAIELGRVD